MKKLKIYDKKDYFFIDRDKNIIKKIFHNTSFINNKDLHKTYYYKIFSNKKYNNYLFKGECVYISDFIIIIKDQNTNFEYILEPLIGDKFSVIKDQRLAVFKYITEYNSFILLLKDNKFFDPAFHSLFPEVDFGLGIPEHIYKIKDIFSDPISKTLFDLNNRFKVMSEMIADIEVQRNVQFINVNNDTKSYQFIIKERIDSLVFVVNYDLILNKDVFKDFVEDIIKNNFNINGVTMISSDLNKDLFSDIINSLFD